jgi:uncharacterized protein YndB with AHSA1/START domain
VERSVTLEWRTRLGAPRARVFAALTEAAQLAAWFCDAAESEPETGGRLALRWKRAGPGAPAFAGRWVHFDRPFACIFEGGHEGYPDEYAGRVAFVLEPAGPATLLTTRHALPDQPEYAPVLAHYRDAWPTALARLAAHVSPEAQR